MQMQIPIKGLACPQTAMIPPEAEDGFT